MWWLKKKKKAPEILERKPEPITFDPRDDVWKRAENICRFMGFYYSKQMVDSLGRGLMHYQEVDQKYAEYLKQQKRIERAEKRKQNA